MSRRRRFTSAGWLIDWSQRIWARSLTNAMPHLGLVTRYPPAQVERFAQRHVAERITAQSALTPSAYPRIGATGSPTKRTAARAVRRVMFV